MLNIEQLKKELEDLIPELPEKNDYNISFVSGFLSCRRILKSYIKNLLKKIEE